MAFKDKKIAAKVGQSIFDGVFISWSYEQVETFLVPSARYAHIELCTAPIHWPEIWTKSIVT